MEKTLAGKAIYSGFALALAISFLMNSNCFASTISLQWDPVTVPDLAGYRIYYSTSNQAPFTGTGAVQGVSPVDVTGLTTATITGLDPGIPYYFAVTAYNSAGVEGPYSNIVEVPELIPPNVSITSPTGSTASGTVAVTANASDNIGVSKLEFYVNGQMQGTDTTTPYLYSWDTSNVASGSYTLMARAYDAAGNIGQSEAVSVTVVHDTTAPTVVVTAPANGATITGPVGVTATANDDVGVTKVEYYANGTLLSAGNVAPYSFTWDTTTVSNGSYTISSKAYDAQGNVGQSSNVTVTVLNDGTAPTVAIASPATNTTAGGSVVVSVNASDNVAVRSVELYVNSVLQGTSTSAPYNFTWNTTALANGSYILTAKAYDTAGNMAQSSNVAVTVSNDSIAPTVSISSPTANSTASGSVSVSASASDNVAVSRVEFYVNGNLQATNTSAPYSFGWNTTAVANGPYTITAKAYDTAGNIGQSSSVAVTVFNDNMAPAVSILSPAADSTTGGSVVVSATASDNVAVSRVEFYVNGNLQATSTSAPYSFGWNTTAVANGPYTITAKAYDTAGNIGQSSSVAVTVFNDNMAPTVSILSPVAESTTGGSVVVSASASDNVAVSRVEFYVNGTLQGTSTSAPYSYGWNTSGLANGSYTLTAKAYDAAGNIGQSASVAVNVLNDTTAPTISFLAPTTNYVYTNKVTVQASATDNVAVVKMQLYVDGVLKSTTTSSSLSVPVTINKGLHSIVVKALDSSNNLSSKTITVQRIF